MTFAKKRYMYLEEFLLNIPIVPMLKIGQVN